MPPRMPAAAAAELIALLEDAGIAVWVDGGWAVDAALGEQTREHGDLDVALEERFVPRLRAALAARGFVDVPRDDTSPWNFVLGNASGLQVDVHAFVLDEHGDGVYGPPANGHVYRAEALTGEGTIAGRRVRCISPVWLVRFRTGYPPREVDRMDVAALCERFGIEVPEAYRGDVAVDALAPPIAFDDFLRVELRVGRIVRAEVFAEARKPAYVLEVDFGPAIGVLRSSAQITDLYAPEELVGRRVVGVVNLPPKRVGPVVSACLITGFHDEAGRVVLCAPDGAVPLGAKLL